jgi:2-keto-4-pentenoate hydratase/2-oxohepta-3-ene-1,7-dioic acid hydratase in catechol pathway
MPRRPYLPAAYCGRDQALSSVAGLAVGNDLTMRDFQKQDAPVATGQGMGPLDTCWAPPASGIGFRRETPLLLGPGNRVAVEVEGVGRIENAFVEDHTQAS